MIFFKQVNEWLAMLSADVFTVSFYTNLGSKLSWKRHFNEIQVGYIHHQLIYTEKHNAKNLTKYPSPLNFSVVRNWLLIA